MSPDILLWAKELVGFFGVAIAAVLVFGLGYIKYRHDVHRENKNDSDKNLQFEVMAMAGILKANADLRDELRKDYDKIKTQLQTKNEENDKAWARFRECETHRVAQEMSISNLRILFHNMECEFAEFKKACEVNHGNKNIIINK